MTKEEILLKIGERIAELSHNASQICEEYEGYRLACMDISDLLDEIEKELSQPSLPSNLDEAAENIAWDIAPNHPDISWDNCFEKIKKGIKAGAEWMAGQGCTVEIDEGYFINNPHNDRRKGKFHKYYSSVFGHSKEITVTPGDNLVVQIRKK